MIVYLIKYWLGNLNFISLSFCSRASDSGFFDEESPVAPHAAAFMIVKQVALRYSTVSGHLWFDYCPSFVPQNVVRRAAGVKQAGDGTRCKRKG